MMHPIDLDIAGWRVRLDILAPALAQQTADRYSAFLTAGDLPTSLVARVEVAGHGSPRRIGSTLDLTLNQESHTDVYRLEATGFRAHVDLARGAGMLALENAAPLADLEHFLRVLVALLAFREGGLLIHAAGLRSAGQVRLFIGQSGSGKSTVVALSPHAVALNDDLIVLRPQGEPWIAHGTPFWNLETGQREGQTACGPLAGIYKLVQDSNVYLQPISPAAATAELLANCPVINGSPAHLTALLLRCRQLARAVPVQRLHFREDGSFWQVLEQQERHSKGDDCGAY
jgi:hypothetical protein